MGFFRKTVTLKLFWTVFMFWVPGVFPSQANDVMLGVYSFHPISVTSTGQKQLELAANLGLEVARIGVSWRLMHPDQNKTPAGFWPGLEQAVSVAESKGMKVILVVSETPCWASGDPSKICRSDGNHSYNPRYPPADVNDYANAMQELVKHFGNRIYAWEIWNEPNIAHFWPTHGVRNFDGFWPDPVFSTEVFLIEVEAAAEYAELLKAAYVAIKSVDKFATVLGGSIAGADTFYLNALYNAGIKGRFDALAIHPYTAVLAFNLNDTPTGCVKPPWCYKTGVEKVRELMVDVYDDDKPIWFTEFGVSSFHGYGGIGDEQKQADFLAETLEIMKNWDFVPVAAWFNLVDANSAITSPGYGLYRSDLSLKPVGAEMQAHISSRVLRKTPVPFNPKGMIYERNTGFSWRSVAGAISYSLWVNEYATPPAIVNDTPGKIQKTYTPGAASCRQSNICRVNPGVSLNRADAQWWVTAHFSDGSQQVSPGTLFKVEDLQNRDSDGDSVIDSQDNCIFAANPRQRDTDHDGYGNYCDPDFTNNGRINSLDYDYFRVKFNSADQDTDLNGDGIVNVLDEVILKPALNGHPGPACCVDESASGLW